MQQQAFGAESKEAALCQANFAVLLRDLGDYEQAETRARQALALRRKLLGEVNQDVANSLCNLAMILQFRRAYEESERCGRQALAISRQLYQGDHMELADA